MLFQVVRGWRGFKMHAMGTTSHSLRSNRKKAVLAKRREIRRGSIGGGETDLYRVYMCKG